MKSTFVSGLGALLACAVLASPAHAARLILAACDQLSLTADNEPLTDILKLLAREGVVVKVDQRITTTVTAQFEHLDMEKAIRRIVSPNDFVLVWDVVKGPLGPIPKLAEVQVFQPGKDKQLTRLAGPSARSAPVSVATNLPVLVVPGQVLVRVKPGTRLSQFKALLARVSGTVVDCFEPSGVYLVRVPKDTDLNALVAELRKADIVDAAEPNLVYRIVQPNRETSATGGTPIATSGEKAAGSAAVAVLDSGLDVSAISSNLITASVDALDPQRPITDPVGHGTQMALIAAGLASPIGVTPTEGPDPVSIVAVRAFDDNGYASNFSLLRAVAFAADHGVQVINMSWESSASSQFLDEALACARAKGIVLVAAAGNAPTGQPVYPAACAGVVAVSALAADGQSWDQSNYGDFVTLAAPGFATFPAASKEQAGLFVGTSISAAFVSRALAEYRARHPDATGDQAVKALVSSLTDAGPAGIDPHYGAGAFDSAAQKRFAAQ